MKYNFKKAYIILVTICLTICIAGSSSAHSGRTDSRGGHKDNQNKSGLGGYHYHCGGNPPHLHSNGVCPYSSGLESSSSAKSSSSKTTTSTSSSTVKTTFAEQITITATKIKINESISSMKVGEKQKLTTTIIPTDTTNKNVVWKSSDESIAIVSSTGEITAKKLGTVNITATTSNGKESTVKINIEEEKNNIIQISSGNNAVNNIAANNSEDSNSITGIIGIGVIGVGCYWGYKKYKKSKQ